MTVSALSVPSAPRRIAETNATLATRSARVVPSSFGRKPPFYVIAFTSWNLRQAGEPRCTAGPSLLLTVVSYPGGHSAHPSPPGSSCSDSVFPPSSASSQSGCGSDGSPASSSSSAEMSPHEYWNNEIDHIVNAAAEFSPLAGSPSLFNHLCQWNTEDPLCMDNKSILCASYPDVYRTILSSPYSASISS